MKNQHSAVLDQEDVLAICKAADEGWGTTILAAEFGVTRQAINKIKSGQRWGWLTGRGTDPRNSKKEQ